MSARPVVVIHVMTNMDRVGPATALLPLIDHLRQVNVDTIVCAGDGELRSSFEEVAREVVVMSIRKELFITRPLSSPLAVLRGVRILRTVMRKHGARILHAHQRIPLVLCRIAASGTRLPVVLTAQNLFPTSLPFQVYRGAHFVAAVSNAVRDRMISSFGYPSGRVEVIPNSVPQRNTVGVLKEEARRRLGVQVDRPCVVSITRMHPQKQLETLLAIASELSHSVASCVFVLLGVSGAEGGDYARKIRGLRDDLGLRDTVVFAGRRPDARDLLVAGDVFLLTSEYEGLPVALLEAMQAGVAPLCTRVAGVEDVVTSGENGVLFEVGDVIQGARQLVTLLREPGYRQRLGAQARRTVDSSFTSEESSRKLARLYDRVLDAQA